MRVGAFSTHKTDAPNSPHIFLLSLLSFAVSLTSIVVWKASDVDCTSNLDPSYAKNSYLWTALLLIVGISIGISMLKKITHQELFFRFQKYSLLFFGLISLAQALFHISQYNFIIYIFM